MALNKKHDPRLEALILQAAADIKRVNPHIGALESPAPDSDYAEIERDREELERVWDEVDLQRGGPVTSESAAQAVSDDRGE
jgi:hypothetical protein